MCHITGRAQSTGKEILPKFTDKLFTSLQNRQGLKKKSLTEEGNSRALKVKVALEGWEED